MWKPFQFVAIIEEDTVANFSGLSQDPALPGTGLTFNITTPDTMEISYLNNSGTPATLADGSTVLNLRVNLVGDINESTRIRLISIPSLAGEVTRRYGSNSLQIPVNCFSNGIVLINNPAQLTVSGNIMTADPANVGRAEVALNDLLANTSRLDTSDTDGNYSFSMVSAGRQYSVRPSKDINWVNGISTADLALIQRHVVNLDTFTNCLPKGSCRCKWRRGDIYIRCSIAEYITCLISNRSFKIHHLQTLHGDLSQLTLCFPRH